MAGHLVSTEEKEFALYDRSTYHSAKLITLQSIPLERECIASIEHFVSHEFKKSAVKIIRARLRYDIDGTRRMLSVLCRHGTGFNFEFLQSIRKRQRQLQIPVRIIVRSAVQQVRQARSAL